MKKLLMTAATLIALATPAMASYTGCFVKENTEILNRPGGNSDPRWSNLKKGQGRRYSRRFPGLGFRHLWQ
jgi:hypothetical protein